MGTQAVNADGRIGARTHGRGHVPRGVARIQRSVEVAQHEIFLVAQVHVREVFRATGRQLLNTLHRLVGQTVHEVRNRRNTLAVVA